MPRQGPRLGLVTQLFTRWHVRPEPAQATRVGLVDGHSAWKPREENMNALILKRYGKTDQVAFADIPRPSLKPDEILVQFHAGGLNPIDDMIPKGTFKV
jgi:hypothetical protein